MMSKSLQQSGPRCLLYTSLLALFLCTIFTFLTYTTTGALWENQHLCYGYRLENVVTGVQKVIGQTNSTHDVTSLVSPAEKDAVEGFTKYVLSPELVDMGLSVLDAFADLARQANVTWFICCGTLLGSYRHHQMIPWDQDFDVLVSRTDRRKLVDAYSRLDRNKYGVHSNERWTKMYHTSGWKNSNSWRFPQLDIFWTDENATHLWINTEHTVHSKSVIFPLVDRPFHGRMYPAPRDPRRAIEEIYTGDKGELYDTLDLCQVMTYDNLRQTTKLSKDRVTVPCAQLVNYFPFVKHIRGPGGAFCKEELEIQGRLLNSFTRSARNIPVC